MAHKSHVNQFFHFAPGLHVALVDVRLGVRASRSHITVWRMEVRKGPMDQVQIEVLQAKVCERLAARGNYIVLAVFVVPQLRGDPEILPPDASPQDGLQRPAHFSFVSIDRSAIEVPVAYRGCPLDRLGNLTRSHVIGSERAQADSRHCGAGKQASLWNRCWIDRDSRPLNDCAHPAPWR